MWVDVAGGQLQVAIGGHPFFTPVSAPGLIAVGVTVSDQSPKLPNVPTLTPQRIEGYLVTLEMGLSLMRETLSIFHKPKNLKKTREGGARDVAMRVKLAVDLGIKLD